MEMGDVKKNTRSTVGGGRLRVLNLASISKNRNKESIRKSKKRLLNGRPSWGGEESGQSKDCLRLNLKRF